MGERYTDKAGFISKSSQERVRLADLSALVSFKECFLPDDTENREADYCGDDL